MERRWRDEVERTEGWKRHEGERKDEEVRKEG